MPDDRDTFRSVELISNLDEFIKSSTPNKPDITK